MQLVLGFRSLCVISARQHYETEEFVNRVDEALVILKEQKVLVREFKLRMKVRDTIDASCIDNWMQLPMKNHIKKLDLGIEGQENIKSYTLPRTIFGAEALTVLKLRGCKLVDSLFGDNNEKFTVLRELSIEEMDVYPSEWKRVQKLLSCCPSLEALTVDMSPRSYIGRCKSSLQLVNVPRLKKAYLRNVQKIRIEAPALRTLYCEGWIRAKLDLNLIACNNVKELEIKGFRLTKKFFQELNSKFPLLEDLAVLFDSKDIDFSSHRLKRLHLHHYSDSSPTVKINCENLRSFKYSGTSTPSIILVNSSSLQEAEHNLFNNYQITMRWLLWLRRYVGNFQQNQVLNFWCTDIPLQTLIRYEAYLDEESIPPRPNIKHLMLSNVPILEDYTALIDGLLWSCHPKILSAHSNPESKFIKPLYETLVGREEKPKCCNGFNNKCWRHY